MISLARTEAAAICREGEKAYPGECCGALLGKIGEKDAKETEAILPVVNTREAAEQYHRFEIGPEDYLEAEKEAGKQHRDILGFYHSHPDHPAKPSAFDRDHALPFYSYIIVSVEKGKAGEIKSWQLTADRSEFREEEITWR